MSQPTQSFVRNCLFSALPQPLYGELRPHLEAVTLHKNDVLAAADRPFSHVYFLERGIGSVIVATADRRRVEAGIFGREGISGLAALLGTSETAQTTVIQVAGDGYRVEIAAFRARSRRARPCSPRCCPMCRRCSPRRASPPCRTSAGRWRSGSRGGC